MINRIVHAGGFARSTATLAALSITLAGQGSLQAADAAPLLALPPSMLERQTDDVRIDAASGSVTIGGRRFQATKNTRISFEDPRTGTFSRVPSLTALPSPPELIIYETDAEGALSSLIVLQQD